MFIAISSGNVSNVSVLFLQDISPPYFSKNLNPGTSFLGKDGNTQNVISKVIGVSLTVNGVYGWYWCWMFVCEPSASLIAFLVDVSAH